jgi:hypothetical protein
MGEQIRNFEDHFAGKSLFLETCEQTRRLPRALTEKIEQDRLDMGPASTFSLLAVGVVDAGPS